MRSVVIGTAGHIDHGKSALVRALTGVDPDRLKEEKARGITIELGFAHYQDGDTVLAFVDVPGHERFVKTMLAGASGIDIVLLVVAADESVMPQTREHFEICRLLNVTRGILVFTKSDLVDAETLQLVQLETRELVAGSFLDGAPEIAVSSKTGEGLEALRMLLRAAAAAGVDRPTDGVVRLPIDRVFSMKGFGTVVTGTLVSGRLRVDEVLHLLPRDREVKIRGIQVHGTTRSEAVAGQRAAVNLGGIDLTDVERGDTLTRRDGLEPTRRFDGELNLLPGSRPLRHGARVRFHHGTSEILGRVAIAVGNVDAADIVSTSAEVPPGSRAYVRIRLEHPAVITRGDHYILRAYSPSVTIGGGRVLDPQPPRGGTRTDRTRRRFFALAFSADSAADAALRLLIDERNELGVSLPSLTSRLGMAPAARDEAVGRLVSSGAAVTVQDLLVGTARLETLGARVLDDLGRYHEREPLSDGLAREEARERHFGRASPAVFDYVIARLAEQGRLVASDRLALASHALALSPEETRARDAIIQTMAAAGLTPPDAAALGEAARCAPDVVERVLKLLVRKKTLIRIDSLVFHADVLADLKQRIRDAKAGGVTTIDVGRFKEEYRVTRKFAIPLLEYLDRERVTRRVGQNRIVL